MNQQVPDELISAYFDGEVTPEERERVEALFASSMEVRQMLDDTAKLSALLHSFPREAAPSQFSKNVQRQIASAVKPVSALVAPTGRSLRREWVAFGAGMTATIASLVLWVSLNPFGNRSQEAKVAQSVAPVKDAIASAAIKEGNLPRDHFGVAADSHTANDGISVATSNATSKPVAASADALPAAPSTSNESAPQLAQSDVTFVSDDIKLPQPTDEFLRSLKNGDVIEQHIRDPNNVVMVVELTVVDVNKGVDGLQLLLQKRNLRQLENGSATVDAGAGKPVVSADGLGVVYVRASGVELSETLAELIKDQPDLYRGLVPQLPMEFPGNGTLIADTPGKSSGQSSKDDSYYKTAANDQQSVAVEANLVVQNFAISNGMAVDQSLNVSAELVKQYQSRSAPFSQVPVAPIGGTSHESAQVPTLNRSKQSPSQADFEKGKPPLFGKSRRTTIEGSQGYVQFRLAADQQRQQTVQQSQVPEDLGQSLRNKDADSPARVIPPQNSTRSNLENRDAGLMRMLIIVKPE